MVVQSRQKSNANLHCREVEFEVGDYVFLKVTPMRSVMRCGVKAQLGHGHNVFHVSMMSKYTPDPSDIIEYEAIPLQEDVTCEEQPIRILVRELKVLRNREIPIVKVLWQNHREDEATWESKSKMYEKYPHLFNFQLELVL
ncbi:uncharacterized protein LOC133792485 [Humulus lupulus]|uniref:uncharacterized protein LOC133792485 n=1 Tax=Humulus lupulus TaxID=3486 RepID=UPI002B409094|nr:uncharacterized protein LOC133792485 [Humulus lupulus]